MKMAASTATSTKHGIILSSALLLLFLNIDSLASATPIYRPSTCLVCTDADRARCPVITPGPDCEVVDEPNCGCCKMCAKKLGENCGVATGFCETGLHCIPPPMTQEEYEAYGAADYYMEAALGEFICVTRQQFCDILTGVAYEDDSNNIQDESVFVPELCPITDSTYPDILPSQTSDQTHLDDENYDDIFMPALVPVGDSPTLSSQNVVDDTRRPVDPPEAPYQNEVASCSFHLDKVLSKERFSRHEWVPGCQEDGTYYPEQCEISFGLERGRCWCVDKLGIPLTKFIPEEEAHPDVCFTHPNKM